MKYVAEFEDLTFKVFEQTWSCGLEMDKLFARFISYIHHTSDYRHFLSETQHKTAGQDCFKTLILQETWKTQNQHQEELCAFSKVTRLCQEVGCARNRLQFHTKKLKSFLSMQVYAWDCFPRWSHERAMGKLVGSCQAKHAQPHPNQTHQRHSNKH